MVEVAQVTKLMNEHVVDKRLRRMDQQPVQADVTTPGAAAPARSLAPDTHLGRLHAKHLAESNEHLVGVRGGPVEPRIAHPAWAARPRIEPEQPERVQAFGIQFAVYVKHGIGDV